MSMCRICWLRNLRLPLREFCEAFSGFLFAMVHLAKTKKPPRAATVCAEKLERRPNLQSQPPLRAVVAFAAVDCRHRRSVVKRGPKRREKNAARNLVALVRCSFVRQDARLNL